MQRVSAVAAAIVLASCLLLLNPGETGAQDGCTGPSLDEITECFRTCSNLFSDPEAQASCVSACGRINGAG
ncbi:MAG: hypothetical protein QNJ67_16740 [Kiloniellales bacterium]|nr:hypothetical protein [Kiloniellales bacterium]